MTVDHALIPPLIDNAHSELNEDQQKKFEEFKDDNIPDGFADHAEFFTLLKEKHPDIYEKLHGSSLYKNWLQILNLGGEASQFATRYSNMFKSSKQRFANDSDQLRNKLLTYGKGKWDNIEDEKVKEKIRELAPGMVKAFEEFEDPNSTTHVPDIYAVQRKKLVLETACIVEKSETFQD